MAERTAVVTDGEERASLACVRSLGAAGWRVHVLASRKRSLAGASRYASGSSVARPPLSDPAGFRNDLLALVGRLRPALILPVSEASLIALGPDRAAFAPAAIPFPPLDTLLRAADKREVARVAAGVGIAVPETVTLDSPSAELPADGARLPFPVVVKPARSVRPDAAPGDKFTVSYAADVAELEALRAGLSDAAYPVLLQRRVSGPGAGVFLLVDGGEVLAAFAHRRIRERPPSGGVSVFRESVALSPALRDAATRLLGALDFRGVAMVEFKIDESTGTPYLMEVNPRLWGSLQLAIDAGVDFPSVLAAWALGERPDRPPEYAAGVRSRWLWGEADHLLARARAAGGVAGGLREGLACLGEQLGGRGPATRLEVLRRDDPRPFLRESLGWLGAVLR